MRVLALVTDAFGGHGGISKFNRDLLTALCEASDVEKIVAIPRLIPESPGDLPSRLEYVVDGAGSKLRYALTVIRSAFRIVRGPVVLVCGHINLLPLAFLARRLLRLRIKNRKSRITPIPIALVIHGIDAWQPTRSRSVNRLVRRVDAVIAVSEFTRKKFWTWANPAAAKSFILPNCVDLTRFTPGPKPLGLLQRYGLTNKTVLLTVARLSAAERYKGIDEVLEVLPQLSSEIPDLSYLVVGDGDDRPRLMEKARSLGLQVEESGKQKAENKNQTAFSLSAFPPPPAPDPISEFSFQVSTFPKSPLVIFAGHISETEKVDHYRLANAFVMPGRGEGFGIVYLEALACGVPVIASQLDASQEIIARLGEGEAVNPDNPTELRDGIKRALKNKTRARPERLAEYSRETFGTRVHEIILEWDAKAEMNQQAPQSELKHVS